MCLFDVLVAVAVGVSKALKFIEFNESSCSLVIIMKQCNQRPLSQRN